jgi:hypothetical protein
MRLIAFSAATGSLLLLALEAPEPMGSSSPSITAPTRSLYALCCSRNSPASTFMACAQQPPRCQADSGGRLSVTSNAGAPSC